MIAKFFSVEVGAISVDWLRDGHFLCLEGRGCLRIPKTFILHPYDRLRLHCFYR